ncbi:MAG: hypothetical protein ABIH67_03445 [Candidatus Uhrbacteria bacterium]
MLCRILLFIFLLSLLPIKPVQALSISGGSADFDSMLRGSTEEVTLSVGRAYGESGDIVIDVEVEGNGSASIIYTEDQFTIPSDETHHSFSFDVTPGLSLINGDYQAKIHFLRQGSSGSTSGTGMGVISGVTKVVNFTVDGGPYAGSWSGSTGGSVYPLVEEDEDEEDETSEAVSGGESIEDDEVIEETEITLKQKTLFELIDQNNDQIIGFNETSALLAEFGKSHSIFDINSNGVVDIFDLSRVLAIWNDVYPTRVKPPISSGAPLATDQAIIYLLIVEDQDLTVAFANQPMALRDNIVTAYALIDTGPSGVNVADVQLHYDSENYSLNSVTYDASIFSVWQTPPTQIEQGTISFVGGTPDPFSGTQGYLFEMELTRLSETDDDELIFAFLDDPQVYYVSGVKAEVGLEEDHLFFKEQPEPIIVEPEPIIEQISESEPEPIEVLAPMITSSSHPNEGIWSNKNQVSLEWSGDQAGDWYRYELSSERELDYNQVWHETELTIKEYSGVENGRWYFHIFRIHDDQFSPISVYELAIDTEPPEPFDLDLGSYLDENGIKQYYLSFSTIDQLSGIDYYQVADENGTSVSHNPYLLGSLSAGTYAYEVTAFDKAGNYYTQSTGFTLVKDWKIPWLFIILFILFIFWLIAMRWYALKYLIGKKYENKDFVSI